MRTLRSVSTAAVLSFFTAFTAAGCASQDPAFPDGVDMAAGADLGPTNALAAFAMLGGGTLLPVHWGTFDLGLHPWAQPIETLLAEAGGARVLTPTLGRPFEPAHERGPAPWWRAVDAPAAAPAPAAT